jgi:DNA mismatch repair protein MutL
VPNTRIAILPDNVANRIAAGEIIERPAAVVKELLENSLDAGGKHIKVKFSRGGKFSISVEDDGCGMSREEALLAIRRHATSKLRSMDDLNSLTTFGFRGEALPSIGSVSKFRLFTRGMEDAWGTEICINGGKIENIRDCAKLPGTEIIVENLFHNVTARRKFLKSDDTESAHIISLVKAMAFAEAGMQFSLCQDGSEIFVSPATNTIGDRANAIFRHGEKFTDFHWKDEKISLHGTICDPSFANVCRKNIVVFVNSRLIRSDLVNFAICEELGPIFPNHRGILAYIFIKIDPGAVDVNVHPMKMEVRFRNESAVRASIKNCLAGVFSGEKSFAGNNTPIAIPPPGESAAAHLQFPMVRRNGSPRSPMASFPGRSVGEIGLGAKILAHSQGTFDGATGTNTCEEWRFVGTMGEEIALFECSTGLIIFNIKLALRRVTYEKIIANIGAVDPQRLLIPIEISVAHTGEERVKNAISILGKYGFSIYSFGKYDYKIDAIPPWISYASAEIIAGEFLSSSSEVAKNLGQSNMDEFIAKRMAITASSKDYNTQDSVENLRHALLACPTPLLCPSGNAIFFELPFCEINGRFYANRSEI